MTINEIIAVAAKTYPDGQVALYWDEANSRLFRDDEVRDAGDGLARFIAVELSETYDKDATDEAQLAEAWRVIHSAVCQVTAVADAFATAGFAKPTESLPTRDELCERPGVTLAEDIQDQNPMRGQSGVKGEY